MKLTRSSHYALAAALEMAFAGEEPVSVAKLSERNGIPEAALAKVVQQLVRAGIAQGTRGVGGGYRLARPASQVTLRDVIRVFEPAADRPPGGLRDGWAGRRLAPLFDEVDELVQSTFESITLETLARGPRLRVPPPPRRRLPRA